jgi:hypothetical protein
LTLHSWITAPEGSDAAQAASLVLELDEHAPQGFFRKETGPNQGKPMLEIHSVRPARRIGPDNQTVTELVIEMTQRRRAYYDKGLQAQVDQGRENPPEADFIFRGGCTLLVNPETARVKYAVYKNILNEDRLNRTRDFINSDLKPSLRATYLGDPRKAFFQMVTADREDREKQMAREYFGLLHRSTAAEEVG